MIYVDWGYAGKVATVGVLAVVGLIVATRQLAEFAVYCDAEAQRVAREQGDAPDMHDMMPALQPERVARHSAEMAELDEYAEGFVA